MPGQESIPKRLKRLREEIERLSRKAGSASPPRIVGVTKGRSLEESRTLFMAGVEHLAENRWESLGAKEESFGDLGLAPRFHFIGALQRRSLRHLFRPVFLVETLDRPSLLPVLSGQVSARGGTQEVLIELDLTGIPGRAGASEDMIEPLLEEAGKWNNIVVSGFMVMGPPPENREGSIRIFEKGKFLFDRFFPSGTGTLSMGMTDDYPAAVECGSTEVRIGRYFFEGPGKAES
ncbi:MAG: type III PLP-dependent enzyme domain-containing protein [Leptospirales bacterium]